MDKLRFQNLEFPVFPKGRRNLVLHILKAFPFYQIKIFQFPVMLPQFIHMAVKAEVRVRDMNQILETRQRILKALHLFLNPMEGNFQGNGWEIGVVPNQIQILKSSVSSLKSGSYPSRGPRPSPPYG